MLRTLRGHGFDGTVVVEHQAHVFGDKRALAEVLRQSHKFARDVIEQATCRGKRVLRLTASPSALRGEAGGHPSGLRPLLYGSLIIAATTVSDHRNPLAAK